VEEATSWRHDARAASSRFDVPWSWTDGVALIVWFLVANVLVAIALAAFGVDLLEPVGTTIAVFAVVTYLTVLAGAYGWLRWRRSWSWRLLGPVRPTSQHVWTGIGAGVVAWIGFTAFVAGLVAIIDPDELPTQETLEGLAEVQGLGLVLAVLGVVVLASIVEEFIYRSVFLHGLRRRMGVWSAIVISSLVWGMFHFELLLTDAGVSAVGLVPVGGIVLVGFWFGWLFHRTGSLLVPIAAHAAFNGIAFSLAVAAA
jgi:uncharacterized protein